MADNVIHGRFGAKSGETREERVQKKTQKAREEQERIERRAHDAILAKIEERERMEKPKECLVVAQNLWRILSELESGSPKIKKSTVLHRAGEGEGEESTKRLPYLAVDPAAEDKDKRAKLLSPYIKRHKRVVFAAAAELCELCGGDKKQQIARERQLLARLVEGTDYWSSPGILESAEGLAFDRWKAVEERISEISEKIAGERNLKHFFKQAYELGIGVDSENNFVQPAGLVEGYAAFQEKPLPALILTADLPARPSAYLGEVRDGRDLPCTIRLQPINVPLDSSGQEVFERMQNEGLESPTFKGLVRPVLKLWLDLIPLQKEDIVIPVLTVTPRTSIIAAERFDKFSSFAGPVFSEGREVGTSDGSVDATIEAVGAGEKEYDWAFEAAYDAQGNLCFEYNFDFTLDSDLDNDHRESAHAQIPPGYSRIFPVDDRARACLLKPDITQELWEDPRNYCDATTKKIHELRLSAEVPGIGYFPGGTMAALLDRSLFDAPEPARIDRLLDESAASLVGKLDAAIENLRARRHGEGER
jgi:hypothetical protein